MIAQSTTFSNSCITAEIFLSGHGMPEKTATEKILGLYTLLLLSSRAWSLAELARHFSCSKPTMLRLLDRIERLEGVALKAELRLEEGRWQKWYWLDRPLNSNERAHLRFSAEDMRLLAFCRALAAPFLSADMGRLLDDNLRRASALFAEGRHGEASEPYVQPAQLGSIDYAPFAEILNTLLRAIQERRVCEITYARKPDRSYEMAVTRLVSGNGALYAHGWKVTDKGRAAPVHPLFFAVHRLSAVRLTRRTHELATPVEEPGFGLVEGSPFRVRLAIAPEMADHVRERVFGTGQQLEDAKDGGVILSFQARSKMELLAWVLSLGRHAHVLEPDWLGHAVQEEARAILNNNRE